MPANVPNLDKIGAPNSIERGPKARCLVVHLQLLSREMAPFWLWLALSVPGWTQTTSLIEKFRAQPEAYRCTASGGVDICVTLQAVRSHESGFKYSKEIAFVIPRNTPPVQNPDNVMLHLQGHRGVCSGGRDVNFNAQQTLDSYNLPGQFLAAIRNTNRLNSVMVFPISMGKDTDYKNELMGEFGAFAKWVDQETGSNTKSNWHVSGHSGAGHVMAGGLSSSVSMTRRLKSAILLDATYASNLQSWSKMAQSNDDIFIQSVTPVYGATATHSDALKRYVNSGVMQPKMKHLQTSASHCAIPNKHYQGLLETALNMRSGSRPPPTPARPSTVDIPAPSENLDIPLFKAPAENQDIPMIFQ